MPAGVRAGTKKAIHMVISISDIPASAMVGTGYILPFAITL